MKPTIDEHGAGEQLFSLTEVAESFGVSRRSVNRLIARGDLPKPLKVGGASRLSSSDVADYVDKLRARRVDE